MHFQDRTHAGKLLAQKFSTILLDKKNTIVIALPKGGVPVAHQIAKALELPLDLLLVKKIGAPSYPELVIGSVSEDNEHFYNHELLEDLGYKYTDIEAIKESTVKGLREMGSELRSGHAPLSLTYKDIILVDDGISSGATIDVAIQVLKKRRVGKILVASPVASAETMIKLQKEVDNIIVLLTPNPIYSVGEWYENFMQVDTEEVTKIMSEYYPRINKNKTYSEQIKHSDIE